MNKQIARTTELFYVSAVDRPNGESDDAFFDLDPGWYRRKVNLDGVPSGALSGPFATDDEAMFYKDKRQSKEQPMTLNYLSWILDDPTIDIAICRTSKWRIFFFIRDKQIIGVCRGVRQAEAWAHEYKSRR